MRHKTPTKPIRYGYSTWLTNLASQVAPIGCISEEIILIEKVRIQGYRLFGDVTVSFHRGMNIIVGDNESGKTTLLEALNLCLTGRVNGRLAQEELNPFWFHQPTVESYFADGVHEVKRLPQIAIEVFFEDLDALQRFRGVNNSLCADCPGVSFTVAPAAEYSDELAEYLSHNPTVLPLEFYMSDWRTFSDELVTKRPKELAVAFIDSRTVRSSSGIDYHLREILSENLYPREKAQVSIAYLKSRDEVSREHLTAINARIEAEHATLHNKPIGLAMDQSVRSSWESGAALHVESIPFGMSGQGQQASVKIVLAMNRSGDRANYVLVEEPENHLSHTSLNRLINRIERLASQNEQQLFITTHSSFVLNRLGLDNLILIHKGKTASLRNLSRDTVKYFQKLPGYDTLRLVLAGSLVLVEGPSDEIVFEQAFIKKHGGRPIECGIDVLAMGGVALRRSLEVCRELDHRVAVLRDNDGQPPEHWSRHLADYLEDGKRELFVGPVEAGKTLEPQLIYANGDAYLRNEILRIPGKKSTEEWMTENKTEAALLIAESQKQITFPQFMLNAIEFVQ